jgi:hypothetical protein
MRNQTLNLPSSLAIGNNTLVGDGNPFTAIPNPFLAINQTAPTGGNTTNTTSGGNNSTNTNTTAPPIGREGLSYALPAVAGLAILMFGGGAWIRKRIAASAKRKPIVRYDVVSPSAPPPLVSPVWSQTAADSPGVLMTDPSQWGKKNQPSAPSASPSAPIDLHYQIPDAPRAVAGMAKSIVNRGRSSCCEQNVDIRIQAFARDGRPIGGDRVVRVYHK